MNAIEINKKEQELINEINQDASLLESALQYVRKLKKTNQQVPCQYSVDELKTRLRKGCEAIQSGLYKSQSEMRSKHTL